MITLHFARPVNASHLLRNLNWQKEESACKIPNATSGLKLFKMPKHHMARAYQASRVLADSLPYFFFADDD
jgi:hypothetical protein